MRWKWKRSFIPLLRYPQFKKQTKPWAHLLVEKLLLAAKAHKVESFYSYYFSKDLLLVQQQFLWNRIPLCMWNIDSSLSDARFVYVCTKLRQLTPPSFMVQPNALYVDQPTDWKHCFFSVFLSHTHIHKTTHFIVLEASTWAGNTLVPGRIVCVWIYVCMLMRV